MHYLTAADNYWLTKKALSKRIFSPSCLNHVGFLSYSLKLERKNFTPFHKFASFVSNFWQMWTSVDFLDSYMSSHFYLHCFQTFSSWVANGFSGYLPNESFWRRRFRCAGAFCSLFLQHTFLHNSRSNWTGGNNLGWRQKILLRQPPVRFHFKQWTPIVTGYLLLWPIKQRRTDLAIKIQNKV